MDKKEIYEHLAKIYLDASAKKTKKTKIPRRFKNFFFIIIAFIFIFSVFLFTRSYDKKPPNSEIAIVLQPDTVKINFHFDPARKEIYSVDLNKLDLSRFKTLGFSAKKVNYQDNISLRVEFNSAYKEKSEVYLKNISHRWQDYKIPFSEFKNISDWSEILNLSFIVEEWNVQEKRGVVYIDNVRFLR